MIQRFQQVAFITWAKTLASSISPSVEAVWGSSRAPRPQLPYIMLDIISGPSKDGHDDLRLDEQNKIVASGMRYYTLSVNVYGDTANEIAAELQSSFELPTIQELLSASGIAVVREGDVRVLDKLLETDYEGRAQFDFEFAVSKNKVDDKSGVIDKVQLTNEIYPVDLTVVVNE